MRKRYDPRSSSTVSSILAAYGAILVIEHGIGEILQGNHVVPATRIFAYGSVGLPFPFGHEPAVTLLPTYLLAGIVTFLLGLVILTWSGLSLRQGRTPIELVTLSILQLLSGGGYGPFPVLVIAVAAGFAARSSFRWLRIVSTQIRIVVGKLRYWFIAMIFVITLASLVWGQLGGMNSPHITHPTYTELAMTSGLLQVLFSLLAAVAAAAHDSIRPRDRIGNFTFNV